MLLAKSATGLEKNFELPGVRAVAFSSEEKPNDRGPVDLMKKTYTYLNTLLSERREGSSLKSLLSYKPRHLWRRQVDVQIPRVHSCVS